MSDARHGQKFAMVRENDGWGRRDGIWKTEEELKKHAGPCLMEIREFSIRPIQLQWSDQGSAPIITEMSDSRH